MEKTDADIELTPPHLIRWAASSLDGVVDSPRVEAELLLSHATGWSRAELFSRSKDRVAGEQVDLLRRVVDRRKAHEPLQYILGSQSFRGIEIQVGTGVLVPRPETEFVVEVALDKLGPVEQPTVIEVGAGSGAISIALAIEKPSSKIFATEISPAALEWCRKNLESHPEVAITLLQGDLFEPLPRDLQGAGDLVISNPPYLSETELAVAPLDVSQHEPTIATLAGPSGLEVSTQLVDEATHWLKPGGWIVLETHPGQSRRLRALMAAVYDGVQVIPDLSGADRVALGRARGAVSV